MMNFNLKTAAAFVGCLLALALCSIQLWQTKSDAPVTGLPVEPPPLSAKPTITGSDERSQAPEIGARGADQLSIGALAPSFALPEVASGRIIRLEDFRGQKPVVLAFGSCTCPYFRRQVPALEQLARQYSDKCGFLVIYVEDTHPEAIGYFIEEHPTAARPGVAVPTADDRLEMARLFQRGMGVTVPVLVDERDDRTAAAYSAFVTRLVIVDREGKIAFAGRRGPLHLRAEDAGSWLEKEFGPAAAE